MCPCGWGGTKARICLINIVPKGHFLPSGFSLLYSWESLSGLAFLLSSVGLMSSVLNGSVLEERGVVRWNEENRQRTVCRQGRVEGEHIKQNDEAEIQ